MYIVKSPDHQTVSLYLILPSIIYLLPSMKEKIIEKCKQHVRDYLNNVLGRF